LVVRTDKEAHAVNRSLLSLALALVATTALTAGPVGAQTTGPYSADQATAGATVYTTQCVSCHGAKLEGGVGPSLAGDGFLGRWKGKTAGDLNDFISQLMPQTNPGGLTSAQYLAVLAYILQQNGYPAGSAPLTAAKLPGIKIAKQK
jgi:mono/diheme cytochrome c family protein